LDSLRDKKSTVYYCDQKLYTLKVMKKQCFFRKPRKKTRREENYYMYKSK